MNSSDPTPSRTSDHAQEIARIREFAQERPDLIFTMVERQIGVLHTRAQILLTLSGIVISTTGFSGRIIAGTNLWAQIAIIAGVGLVLLAAVVVVWGVLGLHWLTQQPGANLNEWLHSALSYRDRKTLAYRNGMALMILGLTLYVIAIAIMLALPTVGGLPAR